MKPGRLFWVVSILVILLMIVPITLLFLSMSAETFVSGITDSEVLKSVFLTVECGVIATALGLLTGLPLSFTLAKTRPGWRRLLEPLIEVPIVIPPVVAGVALYFFMTGSSLPGQALTWLGIRLHENPAGIVLGMYFVGVPFIVKTTIAGFMGETQRLELMARSLGATPRKVFLSISLPLNMRSIVNGSILMFGRSVGIFGTVMIIAYSPPTIPVLVFERFKTQGLQSALPPALLLVLVSLVLFLLRQMILRRTIK